MEILMLRLEAPLIAFGGAIVDNYGIIRDYPALSMITGLLANALGYTHAEHEKLQRLQGRVRFAIRCDREGEKIQDYQTVDLGQDHLVDTGWTTRGKREDRGGASSKETHIRYRDYVADSIYTVALNLQPQEEKPNIEELESALKMPDRPLFFGRKPCLPSSDVFLRRTNAANLFSALEAEPRHKRCKSIAVNNRLRAWWPSQEGERPQSRKTAVVDERDWQNQIHCGRRFIYEGSVNPPGGGA
jgi:CRISPR system Cascade subunit CasD